MKINKRMLKISTGFALVSALTHTLVGTYETHNPLFTSSLSEENKILFCICWHIVSVTLFALTFIQYRLIHFEVSMLSRFILNTIGFLWICFALLFPIIAFIFHSAAAILWFPQPILLIPVSIFCFVAAKKINNL